MYVPNDVVWIFMLGFFFGGAFALLAPFVCDLIFGRWDDTELR